jgi:hypothetical protein
MPRRNARAGIGLLDGRLWIIPAFPGLVVIGAAVEDAADPDAVGVLMIRHAFPEVVLRCCARDRGESDRQADCHGRCRQTSAHPVSCHERNTHDYVALA